MTENHVPEGVSPALWGFATTLSFRDQETFAPEVRALVSLSERRRDETMIVARLAEQARLWGDDHIDTGSSEFAGRAAAHAAIRRADSLEGEQKRDVYQTAIALLAELRAGPVPPVKPT